MAIYRLAQAKGGQPTRLEQYLDGLLDSGISPDSVEVIRADSSELAKVVLESMNSTRGQGATGLVVGAVQSGKTASMFGLISSLIDHGVNVVIVLYFYQTSVKIK